MYRKLKVENKSINLIPKSIGILYQKRIQLKLKANEKNRRENVGVWNKSNQYQIPSHSTVNDAST